MGELACFAWCQQNGQSGACCQFNKNKMAFTIGCVPPTPPTPTPPLGGCSTSSNDWGSWNVCVGRCRTSSNGLGEWDAIKESRAGCEAACGKDAKCFAYEHKGSTNRCELHRDRISKVNSTG